jgi:hypothetical protein
MNKIAPGFEPVSNKLRLKNISCGWEGRWVVGSETCLKGALRTVQI